MAAGKHVSLGNRGATRRDFLRLAGAAGLTGIGVAACGQLPFGGASPTPSTAGQLTFHSRPDIVVPDVHVITRAPADLAGHIFSNTHSPNMPSGPLVLDGQGNTVWFLPVKDKFVTNVRPQQYQGATALTWWEGSIVSVGYGLGTAVIADDSYQRIAIVNAQNGLQTDLHDFQLTPQGTAYITVYETVETDLSSVGGPAHGKILGGIVQEIDVSTGALLFEWKSTAEVAVSETHVAFDKSSNEPFDYFHVNSIDVLPDGNLLISARNTWALYKVDRTTGKILWRLGGKHSDFQMGDGTGFEFQHDARHQADGTYTLFDDGAGPPNVEKRSRGLVLDVDETARTVSLKQAYTNGDVLATSQGNVQVLPNTNVFIGWGAEPRFTEFTQDGQIVFDVEWKTANQSYRAFRFPWTGHPAEPPTAVAKRGSGGGTTVYASWNGATEVTGWRLLAGPDTQHLSQIGGGARTGFETAIHVGAQHPAMMAQALDAAGNVLGSSAPITAS